MDKIKSIEASSLEDEYISHKLRGYPHSCYALYESYLEEQKGINIFIEIDGKNFLIDSNFPINAPYNEIEKKLDEYLRKFIYIVRKKYGSDTIVKVQEDLGMGNYMNVPGAREIRKVWFIYKNKKNKKEIKEVCFYFLKEEEDELNRKIIK